MAEGGSEEWLREEVSERLRSDREHEEWRVGGRGDWRGKEGTDCSPTEQLAD